MSDLPIFYCINLAKSTVRRNRMTNRFKIANITNFKFVDAITVDDPLIDYYSGLKEEKLTDQDRLNGACSASHLKAIKEFLKTDAKEAFICEDDICFAKNFIEEWSKVKNQLPLKTTLLTCFYMLTEDHKNILAHKDETIRTIHLLDPEHTWGAQLYWITREYAIKSIEKFDKPHKNPQFNEFIIKESGGYLCIPPLVIEDCLDSDRCEPELKLHVKFSYGWNTNNYDDVPKEIKESHPSIVKTSEIKTLVPSEIKTLVPSIVKTSEIKESHPSETKTSDFKFLTIPGQITDLYKSDRNYLLRSKYDWISDKLIKEGSWELNIINLAKSMIKPNSNMIDIGANLGVWSVEMSKYLNKGNVYSFEPQRKTYLQLCANLYLNSCFNVKTYEMALGDIDRKIFIHDQFDGNNGAAHISEHTGELVDMKRLDLLMTELPKIDLIKLDVEDYELRVLVGAMELIKRDKPIIFFESRSHNKMLRKALFEFITKALKYDINPITGHDSDFYAIPK